MTTKKLTRITFCILSISTFFLQSCKEDNEITTPISEKYALGGSITSQAILAGINEVPKLSIGPLPPSFFLDMPPVGNQGQQLSCTSWATAYAGMSYIMNKTNGTNYGSNQNLCSPKFIYNQINRGNCSIGSRFPENLDILVNQGVCTLSEMPYSENECSQLPNSTQINAAKKNKLIKWETVDPSNVINVKTILYSGDPVVLMVKVDDAFENLQPPYILNSFGGVSQGYHAMAVAGYDDSKKAFKILNSWGSNWKDNGYLWISYDFFPKAAIECYSMTIAKSKPTDNTNNGLVLHLPFDGNGNDLSGNNNKASASGLSNAIVRFVPDRSGNQNKAIELGGVNNPSWLVILSSNSLNFSTSFSFSSWLKINSNQGVVVNLNGDKFTRQSLFFKGVGGNYISSELIFNKNGTGAGYDEIGANFGTVPSIPYSGLSYGINSNKSDIGKWIHIAYTYSNSTFKIFKNGSLVYKSSITLNPAGGNSKSLFIGTDIGNNYFHGAFDDFRMYNRELSESEVQKLYLQ